MSVPIVLAWLAAPSAAKAGVSEYEYAGALRGAPLEVMRAPFTGLPIPASAEIVVEGEMPSTEEETHPEGPFGEWPGYYTHSGNECVVRVKRILHRKDRKSTRLNSSHVAISY